MSDPEVSAKLKVTREGDPKAFTEVGDAATDLASKVRDLKPALEAGADGLDDVAKAAKASAPDVAEATQALSDGFRDLARSSSAGEIKTGLNEIVDAMQQLGDLGSDATGELQDSLKDIPGLLDKAREAAEGIEEPLERAAAAAAKIEVPAATATGVQNVATGVDRLRDAVGQIEGPIGKFSGTMDGLQRPLSESARGLGEVAASARETSPAVASAAEEVANALLRLGQSEGLDDLQEGLAAAREAMEDLKAKGTESVEGLGDALEGLDSQLGHLKATVERLADPLAESFDRASERVGEFSKKADAGLAGTKASGAAAQRAIADLETEIARLRAAGEHVSDAQIQGLEQLKAAHHAAIEEVAKNTAAQKEFAKESEEAGRSVSGQVKPIHDFGDLLEGLDPRLAKAATRVGLLYGALQVADETMEKTHEVLLGLSQAVGLTDEAFEKWWNRIPNGKNILTALGSTIGDSQGTLEEFQKAFGLYREDTLELANLYRFLRQQGIDPTNLSLDEAREKYDQVNLRVRESQAELQKLTDKIAGSTAEWERHVKAVQPLENLYQTTAGMASGQLAPLKKILQELADQAIATGRELPLGLQLWARSLGVATTEAEQFAAAQRKVADSQHLTLASIREEAQGARALIAQVIKANKDVMDDADFGKLLKKPIQAVIDDAEKLGLTIEQVSPKMAEWAKHWNIVGTAAEAAAKKHDAAVAIILDKVVGITTGGKALKELADQLTDVVKHLGNLDTLKIREPEAFERLRVEVQEVIDAFLAMGQKVPKALTDIGDKVGVYVGNLDRAVTSQTAFAGGAEKVGKAAEGSAKSIEIHKRFVEADAEALDKAAGSAGNSAAATVAADSAVQKSAGTKKVVLTETAGGIVKQYEEVAIASEDSAARAVIANARLADSAKGTGIEIKRHVAERKEAEESAAEGTEKSAQKSVLANALVKDSVEATGIVIKRHVAERKEAEESAADGTKKAADSIVASGHLVRDSAEATGISIKRHAAERKEAEESAGKGAADAAKDVEAAGDKVAAAGEKAATGAAGFAKVGDAAEGGKKIGEVGEQAKTAGDAVKEGGEAAAGAKEGYDAAAEGLVKFGNANAGAVASVAPLKSKVDELNGSLELLLTTTAKLGPALDGLKQWTGVIDGVIGDLGRLKKALDEVEGEAGAVGNAAATVH
ncbi:MAG TPA: hypothetical protein VGS22_16485 [Thermoanaerobaculia bacterium]|jgi:archaellum component FlaC|nr:hypothetical protein [Thermoanaerobaculia bacterium]